MMEVTSLLTGRRGVGLPFTDACPCLHTGDEASLLGDLTSVARGRQWKYLELRGGLEPAPGATPAIQFHHHTLDLRKDPEDLFAQCAAPVRRAIRKAERNALIPSISTERTALLDFYRLHLQTRQRHGLPPQPISFFLHIHEHVLACGLGFVALVRAGSRPVAGAVFFHTDRHAIYKFGASDASRQELRGNNLVMWEGIKALAQRGCSTLDFGRTSLGQEGLRRFKLGWGAQERGLAYWRLDSARQMWLTARDKSSGLHTTLFRHLPLPLHRLAGALLYPHLD
jgi:hypothetical protein